MSVLGLVTCLDGSDRYEVKLAPSDTRLINVIDHLLSLEETKRNGYFVLYFPNKYFPAVDDHVPVNNFLISGTNHDTEEFQTIPYEYLSRATTKYHTESNKYPTVDDNDQPNFTALDKYHESNCSLVHFQIRSKCKENPSLPTNQQTENAERIKKIYMHNKSVKFPISAVNAVVKNGIPIFENEQVDQKVYCPCQCTTELPGNCANLSVNQLWDVVSYLEINGFVTALPDDVLREIELGTWEPKNSDPSVARPTSPVKQKDHAKMTGKKSKKKTVESNDDSLSPLPGPSGTKRRCMENRNAPEIRILKPSKRDDKHAEKPSVSTSIKRSSKFSYPFKFAHYYYKDVIYFNQHTRNAISNPYATLDFILETVRQRKHYRFHYMVADQKIELYRSETERFQMFETTVFENRTNILLKNQRGEIPTIPGINTWFTYVGGIGNGTCFHPEDFLLNSCNLIISGGEKIWMFVPPAFRVKAKELIKAYMLDYGICSEAEYECLDHKTMAYDPLLFEYLKIPYRMVVQKKQEMVVTHCGAYHAVWNCGKNLAVAINFCGWDYFETVLHLQQNGILSEIDKCAQVSCKKSLWKRMWNKGNDTTALKNVSSDLQCNLELMFQKSCSDPNQLELANLVYDIKDNVVVVKSPPVPDPGLFKQMVESTTDSTIPMATHAIQDYEKKFVLYWKENEKGVMKEFDTYDDLKDAYYSKEDPIFEKATGQVERSIQPQHRPDPNHEFWCVCASETDDINSSDSDCHDGGAHENGNNSPSTSKGIGKYKSKRELSQHIKRGNQTQWYSCKLEHCLLKGSNKFFKDWFTFADHVRRDYETSTRCPVCKFSYRKVKRLAEHIRDNPACSAKLGRWSVNEKTMFGTGKSKGRGEIVRLRPTVGVPENEG